MNHLQLLTVLAALCVNAGPTIAQPAPRISLEAALGRERTTGGEFRENTGVALDAATSVRLFTVRRTTFHAGIAFEGMGFVGDVTSLCLPSQRFTCRPVSADVGGWNVRIDAERYVFSRLAVSGSVGIGWYANGDRDPPGGVKGYPLSLNAIIPLVPHLAAIGTVRRTYFHDYGGEDFRADAWLIGARIY